MASHNHRPRKVHIAHVVLQLDTGGMEKLLVEFARHADREHFSQTFISLGGRGSLAGDIETCGWPVIALNKPSGLCAGVGFRLLELFRRQGIDVVHTHNYCPLIYGAPAARLAGVPVVIQTRHGQSYGEGRRQKAAFRLASLLADRVVCVSDDSARSSAREGVARRKLVRIWNGIDTSRFAYRGPHPGGPAVMVGRMVPLKGVDTLLRAMALVVRDRPAFRLEVAGDGESLPALKKLAEDLGVDRNVQFLGEVRDVAGLLARASLFVLPSLSEGISLTLLEAMARGLPVVATRVGGTPEVVAEGVTGLLVPPGAPAELAEAMRRLWRDPRGCRMGLLGRQRVERHFDIRRMVGDYEALYLRLLGRASGPPLARTG